MSRKLAIPRLLTLSLVCIFFAVALINIDRATPVHDDEPWILSPGYTLLNEGRYGSSLMTGFGGMEQRYLQFLPLFPLAQGLMVYATGPGVLQMRFLPVALGVLTMALVFVLACSLRGAWAGALAAALVLFWQWMPGTAHIMLPAGIPLLDLSRIARYDIMVAPATLAALWAFVTATQQAKPGYPRTTRLDVITGLCIGWASLSQIYGLFWLAACGVALAFTAPSAMRWAALRRMLTICGAAGLVMLPWAFVIATHFDDAVAQSRIVASRFDVLNPAFYLTNLLNERRRYFVGIRNAGALGLPGFWLLLAGVPLAWAMLFIAALRKQQRAVLQLCIITSMVMLLFAVLLQPKTQYYLPSIAALLAVLMGVALTWLFRRPSRRLRWAVVAVLGAVLVSGSQSLIHMQQVAARTPSAQQLNTKLRALIAPNQCVLGAATFWLGLTETCYRTFVLAFVLHLPGYTNNPTSFDQVLTQLAPDVVLLDAGTQRAFVNDPVAGAAFQNYLRRHQAQHMATLLDNAGRVIEVYQLKQPAP